MGPGGEATTLIGGGWFESRRPSIRASEQVAVLTGFHPWSMKCHGQDVDSPEVSTPLQFVD